MAAAPAAIKIPSPTPRVSRHPGDRQEGQQDETAEPVTGGEDRLALPPIGIDAADDREEQHRHHLAGEGGSRGER
jgi:hypothetical protein